MECSRGVGIRDGRLNRSRSLCGAEGSFAGLTANVPEAGKQKKSLIER